MKFLASLLEPATELASKFIQDKDQAAKLAHELATMADKHANEVALANIELNKIEAGGNWLQRSWRPMIGMTCALAFAWHFVLQPVVVFGVALAGLTLPELPEFDMGSLLTVLGGLLGLGSLRTFEKVKKVSS